MAEVTGWFDAGGGIASAKLGGATAGYLFEKLCLHLLPMAGLEIAENECISLIKGQLPLGAYQVPVTLSHLPSDFKTSHKESLLCTVRF